MLHQGAPWCTIQQCSTLHLVIAGGGYLVVRWAMLVLRQKANSR